MPREAIHDLIGAEVYKKFIPHCGTNNIRLPMQPGGRFVDWKQYLGAPLTHMLWDALVYDYGYRYIAVFFRDPLKTEHDIDSMLQDAHKRCVIMVNDMGYVMRIIGNKWMKGQVT